MIVPRGRGGRCACTRNSELTDCGGPGEGKNCYVMEGLEAGFCQEWQKEVMTANNWKMASTDLCQAPFRLPSVNELQTLCAGFIYTSANDQGSWTNCDHAEKILGVSKQVAFWSNQCGASDCGNAYVVGFLKGAVSLINSNR